MAGKAVGWVRGLTRSQVDLIVIAALAIPVLLLLIWTDALERFYDYSRVHEAYELDEFIAFLFWLGLVAIIFSLRRIADLRRAMAQREAAEEEAHRLARHDALTGLPNRRRFLEDFISWKDNLSSDQALALFVVDLDRFKPINDLYGHRLGDEVLRVVASRLSKLVAGRGMVARLGGDEFGVLMPFAKDSEAPMCLARQIVYEIPQPIPLAALSIEVDASVGVAVHTTGITADDFARRDGSEIETLLRRADMAMYRAKTEGRGLYRFFDHDMDDKLQQRVELEREIKVAITHDEIVPYYQPLVELATGEIIGYEMLARWEHPTRGVLCPPLFVPIAEDTGVVGDMTLALLARAIEDAKTWPDHFVLSINLSPRQFADSWLAEKVLGILATADFPPHRLEVEITETAVVQRLQEANATLRSLRSLGVRVALDDFGTGYSGLHHLRELHVDAIKIDRSFISEMLDKPEVAKIVEAIVSLGDALGLQTVAEGIETQEALEAAIRLGCRAGQGFLFGRPKPMAGSPEAVRENILYAAGRINRPSHVA